MFFARVVNNNGEFSDTLGLPASAQSPGPHVEWHRPLAIQSRAPIQSPDRQGGDAGDWDYTPAAPQLQHSTFPKRELPRARQRGLKHRTVGSKLDR